MEKPFFISKPEIKQEIEEIYENEESLGNSKSNAKIDIKPEAAEDASLESNREQYEWTIPVFINICENHRSAMANVKEIETTKGERKQDVPEVLTTKVASNEVQARRRTGQSANKTKGNRTRTSKRKCLPVKKRSIELVLVQEQKCDFDKKIVIKGEARSASTPATSDGDLHLTKANSQEALGVFAPTNCRKRRRKTVINREEEKKVQHSREVLKTAAPKEQNNDVKRDLQENKELNLLKNDTNAEDRTNEKKNTSVEGNSTNMLNDSESEELVNLLELKNHIKEKKLYVKPKKNLQKARSLKNDKSSIRNRINLKKKINIEEINHRDFDKTQTTTLEPQEGKTTNDVNLNNNSLNDENDLDVSESESDGFQDRLGVVQRQKRKYTPRRKPELTEDQKVEIERQKLERRTCTICGRIFAFPGILQSHIRSKHTFEKPYSCDFCTDKFARRSSYLAHRRLHLGIKPHLCNVCGKTFLRKASLQLHMRIHIPSEDKVRDVKCEFCSNVYTSKLNLTKHVLTKHTDPSDWKHECDVCHKKCFSTTDLTHHLRRHNDDRKYKCVICGRGFFTKQTMEVHVRTHSASTAFNCERCSNGYRSNEALQRHALKVHGVGEEKPVSMPTHFCPVCNEGFRQRAGLEKHLVFHESGEEEYPFECQKCDKRYKARNYFTIHMLDKHKVFIDDAYFKAYFNSGALKS